MAARGIAVAIQVARPVILMSETDDRIDSLSIDPKVE
jgi:hypothetical protein